MLTGFLPAARVRVVSRLVPVGLVVSGLFFPVLPLVAQPLPGAPSRTASAAEYRVLLQQAGGVAGACSANAQACDDAKFGVDLLVKPDGYSVRLGWLRAALTQAHRAAPEVRRRQMAEVAARVQRELTELDALPVADANAQAQAAAILSQREFRMVDAGPSWWQVAQARFWAWVDRLFSGAVRAGAHRPWIGLAVEWMLLVGALGGLLAYAFRALRQDYGVRETGWTPRFADAGEEDGDWAAMADRAAADGQWREAIHALYWASIGSLAADGRWRRTAARMATRTPREYLRLLEPGSVQRNALGALTSLLERVWYARRHAGERDYARARELAATLGVRVGVGVAQGFAVKGGANAGAGG